MPTYQYACTACDERLEAVQSFHDAPLTECPACGGALRKVFSAVGVVFKGSGFYKTDSRSKGAEGGKADQGEKGGDKGSDKGSDKADKAPAAASASSGSGGSSGGAKDSGSSSTSSAGSSSAKPAASTAPASKSA